MQLNQIKDNEGANKRRIRVGRGIGCTKGKTCGRGVKGQKSRSGVAINGFEGGQMPIHRRLPKRGFTNIHRTEHAEINLGELQRLADAGVLKAGQEVTLEVLVQAGALRSSSHSVKLLGKGALKAKLTLVVDAASKSAVAAVEKAGGSVKLPNIA